MGILVAIIALVVKALVLVLAGWRLYKAYMDKRIDDAIFWGIVLLIWTR